MLFVKIVPQKELPAFLKRLTQFLGTWEQIHNPNFKVVEFDHFRMAAGLPNFVLSVSEWVESTNAIGLIVRKGRYGGTYAHKDIAQTILAIYAKFA